MMNMQGIGVVLLIAGLAAAAPADVEVAKAVSMEPPSSDLMEGIPEDFTRFEFAGNEPEAQWLSRYLWYHFHHRLGNGNVLFNKEYLMTADLWLGNAVDHARNKQIQDVHREDILSMQMDEDGYVHTHQHFSHCHDQGWPFPLWPQVPGGFQGATAGWHFQHDGPDWQWIWPMLRGMGESQHRGDLAVAAWTLEDLASEGIVNDKWRLRTSGPQAAMVSPEGVEIDAFNAPFVQLRWTRQGEPPAGQQAYIEWQREADDDFDASRRVYFQARDSVHSGITGASHSIVPMYKHELWRGKIKRLRIALAPGEEDVSIGIDSIFTVYDTRHTINNPIFILSCWEYVRWTGDTQFLALRIENMRRALRYQQTEMGGLEHNRIRNSWWGHDGIPAYVRNDDGSKTFRPGHGVGSNYWDLMPFGHDDMYATAQYYAATVAMAQVEEAIAGNPEWNIPADGKPFDPAALHEHAALVKQTANSLFWDDDKGRFIATIDVNGQRWDYGYTFLNLYAIWYGIANQAHAASIMEWLTGERIVEGDTSTGEDIYHWRFGPRATTVRNIEWYGQNWYAPESIPWGGQVQDGGAVLGFTFFDLWARLHILGPNDAWERLREILRWEAEVWDEGGYREYYKEGRRGTTLQGGGTAGGLGIDSEFFESSLVPSIITRGFLGIRPVADGLVISPRLPQGVPSMTVRNLGYRGSLLDITATPDGVEVRGQDGALILPDEDGVYRPAE